MLASALLTLATEAYSRMPRLAKSPASSGSLNSSCSVSCSTAVPMEYEMKLQDGIGCPGPDVRASTICLRTCVRMSWWKKSR